MRRSILAGLLLTSALASPQAIAQPPEDALALDNAQVVEAERTLQPAEDQEAGK